MKGLGANGTRLQAETQLGGHSHQAHTPDDSNAKLDRALVWGFNINK